MGDRIMDLSTMGWAHLLCEEAYQLRPGFYLFVIIDLFNNLLIYWLIRVISVFWFRISVHLLIWYSANSLIHSLILVFYRPAWKCGRKKGEGKIGKIRYCEWRNEFVAAIFCRICAGNLLAGIWPGSGKLQKVGTACFSGFPWLIALPVLEWEDTQTP